MPPKSWQDYHFYHNFVWQMESKYITHHTHTHMSLLCKATALQTHQTAYASVYNQIFCLVR